MNIFKKIYSTLKQKSVTITGGFDILRKTNISELDNETYLEQYGKSLYVTRCISKIAEKVASTELELYRILNSRGDTKEVEVSPILDLLYKPNPFQTKTEFWETTIINLKCTGNAYWLKIRNKGGKVVELWNLRPDLVSITSDKEFFIKNYKFQKQDGTTTEFAKDDVVHFKYPSPLSQLYGMSPISSASRRIQTEDYATTYQRDFFVNSARPDALIKNKSGTLSPQQTDDLREGWNRKYKGMGNGSKMAVLHGDLEYQQISISQREMDYIESMKFTRDDILSAFAVPKPIVAIVDDVNRANSETAMFIFLSETIKPEIMRIVEKINEELVYIDFGEEFYIDFEDPTPANRELKLKEYQEGLMSNYLLINEVRQMEGLEPIAGGWSLYLPFSVQPMGGLSQNGKNDKKENKDIFIKEIDTKITGMKKIPKMFSFKGHYWLKEKFLIRESIIKEAQNIIAKAKALSEKKVSKKTNKKKEVIKTSFLKEAVFRDAYYFKINQKIDLNTKKLSDQMNEFAKRQETRVLAKLSKKKGVDLKKKLSANMLMNIEKEKEMTVEFILPFIENYLKESAQEALALIAPQEDFTDSKQIQKLIKDRALEFSSSVTETTISKLDATLAEGIADGEGIIELSDRVSAVYDEFSTYRSDMIARTEATSANAQGSIEGWKQSGVANAKEWINSGDDRVRDEHQDGSGVGSEIVGLDAKFSNGLESPGEPNCRCVLGPAFIE